MTVGDACLDDEIALAFADGSLADPAARRETERHLDGCVACRKLVATLARVEGSGATDEAPNEAEAASSRALRKGDVVGRFVVGGIIGIGGMGAVYAAYDPELDRKVALKVLRSGAAGATSREALLDEGRSMARLMHPNVVAIHDVGVHEGSLWIAMELVVGENLRLWLRRERRETSAILARLVEAGRGLDAAHAVGILHRDFKPDNVLVGQDAHAKVTDFGLARSLESSETSREISGTPAYMSPEQRRGEQLDARSDQYSFAVTAFESLYGEHPPLEGPIRFPDVPSREVEADVRRALARALSPSPVERFSSIGAMLDELIAAPRRRRQRRTTMVVALVALLSASALGVRAWNTRRALCSESETRAAAVWGPTAKRTLEERFAATGSPMAKSSFSAVSRMLDAYVIDWRTRDRASCMATKLDKTQPDEVHAVRAACFTRRLAEVEALVDLMGHADAAMVEHATSAASNLTPLDACDDNEALLVRPAPPSAQASRTAVAELRGDLAKVKALLDAASYDAGLARADAAVHTAESLGYPPVLAEALFYQGTLRDAVSKSTEAEEALYRAVEVAESSRHDEIAAKALSQLVWVIGYRQARHEAGTALVRAARAAAQRAGKRPDLIARLEGNAGTILWSQGDFAAAREHYDTALASWVEAVGPEHPKVGDALNNLALASWSAGELDAALASHEKALDLRVRVLGPDHPDVGASQNNVGLVLQDLGRFAEARDRHIEARRLAMLAHGAKHPLVANAENNLGLAELGIGDARSALATITHAWETRKAVLRPDHPDIANSLVNLALVRIATKEPALALPLVDDALARQRTALGDAHPALVDTYLARSAALRDLGRIGEARADAERATELATRVLGKSHRRTLTAAREVELLKPSGGAAAAR